MTKNIKKPATSRDVAKLAGVSQATVSRALSEKDQYLVSQRVREKVFKAAQTLQYAPNLFARGMSGGKINVIGLVIGTGVGPFYNAVILNLVEEFQKHGKQCLIFKLDKRGNLKEIIANVMQFQVEAIVVTASAMTKEIETVSEKINVPIFLFNRYITDTRTSAVYTDTLQGGMMAAQYLYEKGHHKIGYVKYLSETIGETEKYIGFVNYLRNKGIFSIAEDFADYSYESGYAAGLRLLQHNPDITAVFCSSDIVAIGLMDGVRQELKLDIPKDLSVLGFDNIQMAGWGSYQLTTISQSLDKLITDLVQITISAIRLEENKQAVYRVGLEIVERASVSERNLS